MDRIPDGMNRLEQTIKRATDFLIAAFCIVVFSPLYLICYLAIKLEDGGPALFRQERIGLYGKPFYIYKFRSMSVDAEKDGPALYQHENDDRMTKVGKFLRDHHIDELPQLWNVFRGDMAFIGPRPERKYYIDQIMERTHDYLLIYQMRPGLTSEATIYNGYTDTMEKMLKRLDMDIRYLEHRTLSMDLKILLQTVGCLF